ncbi:hypothetical protein [Sorangium sp. So ce590]|uniref:hypothetical protein n=1 Tax=unclassified Sorangium TaxID=2621164 RepID=UPI003F646FB0
MVAAALADGAERIDFAMRGLSWSGRAGRQEVNISIDMRPFVERVRARDTLMRARLLPLGAQLESDSYGLDDAAG